jgi:hypothetical protein
MRLPLASEAVGFVVLGYVFGVVFPEPLHYAMDFTLIGASMALTALYLARFLPRLDSRERLGMLSGSGSTWSSRPYSP